MDTKRGWTAAAAAAGMMVALGASVPAAGARTLSRTPGLVTPHGMVAATGSKGTPTTYEAGYAASTTDDATLYAIVRVPTITCTTKAVNPVFVTVGLYSAAPFEESGASIQLSCQNGDTVNTVTDDQFNNDSVAVSPGDQIQVTVSANSSGDTSSYEDLTTGAGSNASGAGFTPIGAQTTMQGGFGSGGFPKFGPTKFSQVTVDGTPLATDSPNRYFQASSTGKTQIVASAITKGSNFTDTFVAG